MFKMSHYKFYGYLVLILLAVVYSLQTFGESPAIQISTENSITIDQLREDLKKINLIPNTIEGDAKKWL